MTFASAFHCAASCITGLNIVLKLDHMDAFGMSQTCKVTQSVMDECNNRLELI